MGRCPLASGLEANENIGIINTLKIAAHAGAANARYHHRNFGKFFNGLLNEGGHSPRLGVGHTGRQLGAQHNRAFIKTGNKLRSKQGYERETP